MKYINQALIILVFLSGMVSAGADQTIVSVKVNEEPIVDGLSKDKAWLKAKEIKTYDPIAKLDLYLKTVYTNDKVFFLVRYKQKQANKTHKNLKWDKNSKLYKIDKNREDTFVFKWNMEPFPVNLTLKSQDNYIADIWYWKAFRTDHAGYADDKIQTYSSLSSPKSHRILTENGNVFYLTRKGDKGVSSYKNNIPAEFKGETINSYDLRVPQGSRGDVRAKGQWKDGEWSLEFSRKLNTNHEDDISFQPGISYQFGVSRFEIAGRAPNPNIDVPLYGSGDITENLLLEFQ